MAERDMTQQSFDPKVIPLPEQASDTDKATQYKKLVENLMKNVALIMDAARKEGFVINIGVLPDAFGRHQTNVNVVKPLA